MAEYYRSIRVAAEYEEPLHVRAVVTMHVPVPMASSDTTGAQSSAPVPLLSQSEDTAAGDTSLDDILSSRSSEAVTRGGHTQEDELSLLAKRAESKLLERLPSTVEQVLEEAEWGDDAEDSAGQWHFATQTHQSRGPQSYLVNVPAVFLRNSTGRAREEGGFVNASSRWRLVVFELGPNGALIQRGVAPPGDRLTLPVCGDTVWVVSAAPDLKRPDETVFTITLRIPSELVDSAHKLSLLWMPGVSLAVSRSDRLRAPPLSGTLRPQQSSTLGISKSLPVAVLLQVLDSSNTSSDQQ